MKVYNNLEIMAPKIRRDKGKLTFILNIINRGIGTRCWLKFQRWIYRWRNEGRFPKRCTLGLPIEREREKETEKGKEWWGEKEGGGVKVIVFLINLMSNFPTVHCTYITVTCEKILMRNHEYIYKFTK